MKQHLKIWEVSLLIALCVSLFTGLFAKAEQTQLSRELIRLHVIANSDTGSDQAAKLNVRDSVLAVLTPMLEGVSDTQAAKEVINGALPLLCVESYPTREYSGFALPSGDYLSLKIILGEGRGHNWWCVVFPPLCISSVEDEDAFSGLSEESAKLITYSGNEYRLKFRIIELYEELRQALK